MTYAFGDLSYTRSRTLGLGQWGNIGKHDSFPWHRGKTALKVLLSMSYFVLRSAYYHSFSGSNVCLARLEMELCRAANIFAAR